MFRIPLMVLCSLPVFLFSQVKGLPETALVLKAGAGVNLGIGDLSRRFPLFSNLHGAVYLKTPKKFHYGVEFQKLLGNRVQIDSLYGGILGASEIIFDEDGYPGLIRYYMRGFTLEATASRVFNIASHWPHSGIEIKLGAGFMQHRIRSRFDQGSIPQLEGAYRYGYDRLCNGPFLSQSIQFHYLNTETVSFSAGINFGQGITANRRNWDYSTMRRDTRTRADLMIGISGSILIPIALKYTAKPDYFD